LIEFGVLVRRCDQLFGPQGSGKGSTNEAKILTENSTRHSGLSSLMVRLQYLRCTVWPTTSPGPVLSLGPGVDVSESETDILELAVQKLVS